MAVVETAALVAGELGDFRVLNDLGEMVTERAQRSEDGTEIAVSLRFPLRARATAASAIGRIIEADRGSPPGRGDATGGAITDDMVVDAVEALSIGACTGQPMMLRGSSIEALGLARSPGASELLEAIFVHSGETDPNDDRTLRLLAGRALTNIEVNNHLYDSDVDEEFGEYLRALQTTLGDEP